MIPRKKLDIGWTDLAFGIRCCLAREDRTEAKRRIERLWSPEDRGLACLSVRSGFDSLLEILAFPPGSEILVSSITIRDMTKIAEHHGLVAMPAALDMETLSLRPEALERALTPRTRAILIAHLFGSRMPMEPILELARRHGLLVFEDCAQAFTGDEYRGHPESDVSMFSFGSIKTASALGGGLFRFRDAGLRDRVAATQTALPIQSRGAFLQRLCKYGVLKALTWRPVYSLFVALCRLAGRNHDQVVGHAVRGFAGGDFFRKIRQQPSSALMALLARRIGSYPASRVAGRARVARSAAALLPGVRWPGEGAAEHAFWVFPILSKSPERLIRHLWSQGFDATQGASNLTVVPPPEDRPELRDTPSQEVMERVVYLPIYSGLSEKDLRRLAHAVADFEARSGASEGRFWATAS